MVNDRRRGVPIDTSVTAGSTAGVCAACLLVQASSEAGDGKEALQRSVDVAAAGAGGAWRESQWKLSRHATHCMRIGLQSKTLRNSLHKLGDLYMYGESKAEDEGCMY